MQHRSTPDFLIIGAQKAGTTTLYSLLQQHPRIVGALRKEIGYLNLVPLPPLWAYQAEFSRKSDPRLAFESTPYYLFHPGAPRAAHAVNPGLRLIVLLRDPVARTISHFQHERRLGFESRSLSETIAYERHRLAAGAWDQIELPRREEWERRHWSYVGRGRYFHQLSRWLEFFPRDQLQILKSEEFFEAPAAVSQRVFDFLGLDRWPIRTVRALNAGTYEAPPTDVIRRLRQAFAPDMQRLKSLVDFDVWGY